MKLMESFVNEEQEALLTLPNALTTARLMGGLAVCEVLAKGTISPEAAFIATGVLAATDLEGLSIRMTRRFPRLQKTFNIIPTKLGRKFDPIADKVFGVGVIGGGLIGGQIPLLPGAAILATELATAGVSVTAQLMGRDPEVSKVGKFGLMARFGTIMTYLGANALAVGGHEKVHDILYTGANAATVGAVALGAFSAAKLVYDNFINYQQPAQELSALQPPNVVE
jgi:phosphatidylglycerophosphate synthase